MLFILWIISGNPSLSELPLVSKVSLSLFGIKNFFYKTRLAAHTIFFVHAELLHFRVPKTPCWTLWLQPLKLRQLTGRQGLHSGFGSWICFGDISHCEHWYFREFCFFVFVFPHRDILFFQLPMKDQIKCWSSLLHSIPRQSTSHMSFLPRQVLPFTEFLSNANPPPFFLIVL